MTAAHRVFFWAGQTAGLRFNTGIQRVVRSLGAALERIGIDVVPVGWNHERRCLVVLGPDARRILSSFGGPAGAGTTILPEDLDGAWLLVPETPIDIIAGGMDHVTVGHAYGMRVASIIHDLIPAKLPDFYDEGARALYRAYFRSFGTVDVAIATTRLVRDDLSEWLASEGVSVPPIAICPLSGEMPGHAEPSRAHRADAEPRDLRLIAVGTWEPRKNHPRLLRALVRARERSGAGRITLTIVGLRSLHPAYRAEVDGILAGMGDVEVRDGVSDAELLRLFDHHDASVYGSWEEGFGLPVLESVWAGLPCLCHNGSAMAEVAPGGGCLTVDMLDESAISAALLRLKSERGLLRSLGEEASSREMRSWDAVGADVVRALGMSAAKRDRAADEAGHLKDVAGNPRN